MCKKVMIYFVIACFIFSSVPLSLAQESTAGAQEELPLASKEKETAPGNVTIDFKDADIHNVLRILSYKSEVNIVAGKEVEGTVTVRLVDVPWERALDVVLKTYGFAYEREGNIIRVTTVENLGQEPLKTEVFNISYAKAEDVADSIKEIISERGSVRSDKRSNTVIVTDIPTNLYKIQQVIEKLDEATPQVYIEARLIETVLDDDEKLGIDWSVKISAEGSQIPTTLPFAKDLENSDMLRDKFIPVGDPAASDPAFRDTIRPSFPYTLSNAFSFGTLDFTEFQAVLWMLDERTNTKIISNPRTVTLNNQEATIHIGNSYYIPQWTESATTGSPVFSGMKKEIDTGIKLRVTPHVNSKDEIVVELEPEVSSFTSTDVVTLLTTGSGDTIDAWPVSIRTAKTQIMVKDGETIAIGGLLKEQVVKTRQKVPFLGDIPILGHLFSYSSDTIDTRDLLIFVTVKLIETKEDTVPYFKDIVDRMDEFEKPITSPGYQWEPSTPVGSGKEKEATKIQKLLFD